MLEVEGKLPCMIIKSRVFKRYNQNLCKIIYIRQVTVWLQDRMKQSASEMGTEGVIQASREFTSRESLLTVFIVLVESFDSNDREAMRSGKISEVKKPLRSLMWQIHQTSNGELNSKNKFRIESGVVQGGVIGPQFFVRYLTKSAKGV